MSITFKTAVREKICSKKECNGKVLAKGLCQKHYLRQWKYGDTDIVNPPVSQQRFIERFEEKIEKIDSCWIWVGAFFKSGYGRFSFGKKKVRAHRFSYELYIGKIPKGIYVLHRCDNPCCVNPLHLFLGTHLDNMMDMESKGRAKWIQENIKAKMEVDNVIQS